jgi:hypothetical protein
MINMQFVWIESKNICDETDVTSATSSTDELTHSRQQQKDIPYYLFYGFPQTPFG